MLNILASNNPLVFLTGSRSVFFVCATGDGVGMG